MHFLGLVFMLSALLVALTTGSPISERSVAIPHAKRVLVDTLSVTVNYAFASYTYEFPNARCIAPPPSFGEITEIVFAAKWQFCWFFKTAERCQETEMPTLLQPGNEVHSTLNFTPVAMFCFDPTFKCPGGGECY